MENIADKIDGTSTLPASEFNSHKNEIQALITESGQTLALATTDQLRKAVSIFGRSLYCEDSSGIPNILTLARPNSLTDVNAYYDGMTVMFSTPNANTGATTATVAGLSSKKVRTIADADISSGNIVANTLYTLVYESSFDSGSGAFILMSGGISLAQANAYDIGVGQTWQNVTVSRAAGVIYTNTSGKPIQIKVLMTPTTTTSNSRASLTVDGLVIEQNYIPEEGLADTRVYGLSAIIPNGSTYLITAVSNAVLSKWSELR